MKQAVVDTLRRVKHGTLRAVRATSERAVSRGLFRHASYPAPGAPDPAARAKPHLLIGRYQYHCGGDPASGPSTEAQALDNTLRACGHASFDTFFWDTDYTGFPRGDWALLDKCRTTRPDALVLSSYEPGHPSYPRIETIRLIRKTWGIPVVALWFDTCYDGFWESVRLILPYVDLHVIGENPLMTFFGPDAGPEIRRRFIHLNHPWDRALYRNPRRERDIDVSFLGQVDGYRSPRMRYIEYLMEHNVPLYWSGFARVKQPPVAKMVEILTRSRISLNFSHSANAHQLKGRVFEVMLCGAMLMESANPQTECYLTPGKEYVAYDSPADLVDKARYYLAHEDERLEIAARGEQRAQDYADGQRYWQTITEKLAEMRRWPL